MKKILINKQNIDKYKKIENVETEKILEKAIIEKYNLILPTYNKLIIANIIILIIPTFLTGLFEFNMKSVMTNFILMLDLINYYYYDNFNIRVINKNNGVAYLVE
jgi:uncharacterized protein YqhQ